MMNMTEYCSVKTARKMCSRVLSLEERDVRVLNFTPGVIGTDMYQTVRNVWVFGSELETWETFRPSQSAKVLVQILKRNLFHNCEQIHIADVIEK